MSNKIIPSRYHRRFDVLVDEMRTFRYGGEPFRRHYHCLANLDAEIFEALAESDTWAVSS